MSVSQLQASLDAVDAQIAAFDHTRIAYSVDGRSMDGGKDFESLVKRREKLKQLIINEGGGAEAIGHVLG